MLKQENLSDRSLIVGDINILGKVKGPGVRKVISDVDALKKQTTTFSLEIHDYWTSIFSDFIITPEEKTVLKREYQNIVRSHDAMEYQAIIQNLQNTPAFLDYQAAYTSLSNYLNVTLRLFDRMSENTQISGSDDFNAFFSQYYYSEKFTQIALTTGIIGNMGFRVLESLSDTGTEGEVGLYRGQIYQYTDGVWVAVGLEGYKGTLTSLPEATQNQYFMAEEDFIAMLPLWVNDEPLYINGSDAVYVNIKFTKGLIYVFDMDAWREVSDTTDYRYVVALVDYINVTGELPGAFQEAIDNAIEELDQRLTASIEDEARERQGQITQINGRILTIDQNILQNTADIEELDGTTVKHLPFYFGKRESDPQNAIDTDFYVYSGTTTISRVKGDVYVKNNDTWNHVDPTSGNQANAMYSIALEDILSLGNSNAYTSLFAGAFFSNTAVITALTTRTIRIQTGGSIQSDIYAANTRGFKFDTDGNIDANGNTHIGGSFTADGNTTISGNASFDGTVRARTLYLGDSQDAADLAEKSYVDGKVSDNVVDSQIVYYQDSNAIVSRFFHSPTEWVTDTTGGDDKYTLIQPPYSTTVEKTLYSITQFKKEDGSVYCESQWMELDRARQRLWAQTEGKTVIEGGYIGTNLVHAKSIEAGSISADKIEAGAVTSEKLEADIVIGEDATFSGTLKAAKGTFNGRLNCGSFIVENGKENDTICEYDGIKDRNAIRDFIKDIFKPFTFIRKTIDLQSEYGNGYMFYESSSKTIAVNGGIAIIAEDTSSIHASYKISVEYPNGGKMHIADYFLPSDNLSYIPPYFRIAKDYRGQVLIKTLNIFNFDPHVKDCLWSNNGILTVSKG